MSKLNSPVKNPVDRLDAAELEKGADQLGIALTGAQIDRFRIYYHGLLKWNAHTNLTTVTRWREVQRRHFLESLEVSLATPRGTLDGGRFADVGPGAGFPGIPLKIAFPAMSGALIEATGKKAEFLRWLIEQTRLEDIQVVHGRAESMGREDGFRESFDLVTARAVAPMPALAELTLPLCRVGGRVVVHKTSHAAPEIDAGRYAIGVLGGDMAEIITAPTAAGSARILVAIDKSTKTPPNYPRRPGIPGKRPLMGRS